MKRVWCDTRWLPGIAALFLIAGTAGGLQSCRQGDSLEHSAGEEIYFDLEGLVERQLTLLERDKPVVEKRLDFNGQRDTMRTREVNWRDELGFFLQSDINKASLKDSYSADKPDTGTVVYQLKEGEIHPVKLMKVVYSGETGEVKEVLVESDVENRLFNTHRTLKLSLSGSKADNRVVSYEIKGYQQLALTQKKNFEIISVIR